MVFHWVTVSLFLGTRHSPCSCFADTDSRTGITCFRLIIALRVAYLSVLLLVLFHQLSSVGFLLNWCCTKASLSGSSRTTLHCILISISVSMLYCFMHLPQNKVSLSKQPGRVYPIEIEGCGFVHPLEGLFVCLLFSFNSEISDVSSDCCVTKSLLTDTEQCLFLSGSALCSYVWSITCTL